MSNINTPRILMTVILSFLSATQSAKALQVVSFDNDTWVDVGGSWNEMHIAIGYGLSARDYAPLFDSIILSPSSVGQTYSISSLLDDPDFDAFSTMFTDGVTQTIAFDAWVDNGFGGGWGGAESQLFSGTTPDAVGYVIERYDVIINELTMTPIEWGTHCAFNYTFQAYGSPIPEPATSALLFLGALPLTARVRKGRSLKRND